MVKPHGKKFLIKSFLRIIYILFVKHKNLLLIKLALNLSEFEHQIITFNDKKAFVLVFGLS